jgi:hypothetical protein
MFMAIFVPYNGVFTNFFPNIGCKFLLRISVADPDPG